MKKLGTILVLFLGLNAIWAQGPGGGQRMSMEERQAQELKNLTKALDLDENQITAVKELQADFAKEAKELRSGMQQGGDRQAMREGMYKLRNQFDVDVKAVLTKEQYPKFEEYIKNRDSQMQQRQGQGQRQGQKTRN